jgi:hypothetical protein
VLYLFKTINRRLLTAIIWFIFSIGSLSWWRQVAVLTPEDNPIWWPNEFAQFLPGSWLFFALVAAALSVLYILELIDNKPAKLKQILFWVFVLGLGAVFVYPLGTKDIFNYVSFARLHVFYGLNPHMATVSDISNYLRDPFLKNMFHITCVSPYGPLWTWLSYVLYYIVAGFGLIPFIISFKVVGLLMHLLITYMIYKVAEILSEGSGSRAAIIYGMNPLAIFELIANAHNDGPAILLLLLSLFLVFQKRTINGLIALSLSVSFKFTSMLTVPFFILRAARERGPFFAGLGAAIVVLTSALFYTLTKVNIFGVMQTSTGGFLNFSFVSLVYALAGENLLTYARKVGLIVFLFWYYTLLRKLNNKNMGTLNIAIGLGFVAYFMFGAVMVHRWYYLWPLAVTSITPDHPWTKAVVIQTIILLPCYTLTLAFGEVNIDKSITYILASLPVLVTGLLQYRHSLKMGDN